MTYETHPGTEYCSFPSCRCVPAGKKVTTSNCGAGLPDKPFYGAQCPSYPACNGGCGLGCTHEIETRKGPHSRHISQHIRRAERKEEEARILMREAAYLRDLAKRLAANALSATTDASPKGDGK